MDRPTKDEIAQRIHRLHAALCKETSDWSAVFIFSKISQYYLTGTMQDGVFVLRPDGEYAYFARRSYERAKLECLIDNLFPMRSYRDMQSFLPESLPVIYMDKSVVTMTVFERLAKAFRLETCLPAETVLQKIRAVKSPFELERMTESGRLHNVLLEEKLPPLLQEGMSETDLTAAIYKEMILLGHHGVSRFAMFQTEMILGQLGFGENAIYPASFDGPGGMKGMSPAVPIIGDRSRKLQKGDLVFIDIGFGIDGYHSDRTQIYSFGAAPASEMAEAHNRCLAIQQQAAAMLKPGAIPSKIYEETVLCQDEAFLANFMGLGNERVKFLGHGVGLHVDEYPVIARGFDAPLQENMVLALEPKKSFAGRGLVGVEDTYIVTPDGGKCITGGEKEIIVVC